MQDVNILLADNEQFKFVKCLFYPFTGQQGYSYKTMLDVEVDDFVVVETPSNGFQTVKVVEVQSPMDINFNTNIKYKWVIQKLDFTHYELSKEQEKALLQIVNKSKNKRAVQEAKTAILENLDSDAAEQIKKLVRL